MSAPTAFRRKVFYIPGYDPFPPRRYRELFRTEGALQAAISGYTLDIAGKSGNEHFGWTAHSVIGGAAAEADFEVLVWSDLVKSSMAQGIAATYLQLLRTAATYIGSGALFRLMRLRKGPMIAALYPIVFLLAQLVIALMVGVFIAALHPAAWPLGLAAGYGILRLSRHWDHKVFAYYLMHDYAYTAQAGGANPAPLSERMSQFGTRIRASLDAGFDEVLVVGHSSGAHLGVSILADLLRAGIPQGSVLSFLTLGQVVPMVSFLPRATRLRGDLNYLCQRDQITWVDVTAPGDGCAFALCDPVSVTGVAPDSGKIWPLVTSAAFTQTLSPARWAELRWRFFRLHFQYLCAFDRAGHYDYFAITAGAQTLGARYAGQAPSKSRIETAVSGHRGMV